MMRMTAQDAFQSWIIYCGVIAAGVIALAFGVLVFVVAFDRSREKDE
jgi:hypothetical protein